MENILLNPKYRCGYLFTGIAISTVYLVAITMWLVMNWDQMAFFDGETTVGWVLIAVFILGYILASRSPLWGGIILMVASFSTILYAILSDKSGILFLIPLIMAGIFMVFSWVCGQRGGKMC